MLAREPLSVITEPGMSEGQRFGDYSLISRIAMGGMAEIWLAKRKGEAGFEKRVVLKRILPHYADDEDFTRMFLDEARLAALLDHPNIVHVNDFGSVEGQYYIAMEYVDGFDLRRVDRQMRVVGLRFGPNRAAQIGLAMARGLGYAHAKKDGGRALNIVHRDVSPHNVLVSMEGDVKVMDFGIAKASARVSKTATGVVKGKVAYMSPEQARGDALTQQSDIFSTGVVLWELLTGRRLHEKVDSDLELLKRIPAFVAERLDTQPSVPTSLADIVARMLAVDLSERYASMREVEQDLARCLHELGGAHAEPLQAMMQDAIPDEWHLDENAEGITNAEAAEILTQAKTASGSNRAHVATRRTQTLVEDGTEPSRALGDPTVRVEPSRTISARPTSLRAWRIAFSALIGLCLCLGVVMLFLPKPPRVAAVAPAPEPERAQPASQSALAPLPQPVAQADTPPKVEAAARPAAEPKRRAPSAQALPLARLNLIQCSVPLEIFVDGRRFSTATVKWTSVPIGAHKVHAQTPDGRMFATQDISIANPALEAEYDCKR